LISNFRLVLNVVFFLLGDSPESEFYMLTFRNISKLHRHRWRRQEELFLLTPTMKMEMTECSETSEHNIQTPGNNPKERIQ